MIIMDVALSFTYLGKKESKGLTLTSSPPPLSTSSTTFSAAPLRSGGTALRGRRRSRADCSDDVADLIVFLDRED